MKDSLALFAELAASPRRARPPEAVRPDALPAGGPYDCTACGACCVEAGPVPVRAGDTSVPPGMAVSAVFCRVLRGDGERGLRVMDRHMGGRREAMEGVPGEGVSCSACAGRPAACASFAAGSGRCLAARAAASAKMARPERGPRGYGRDWERTCAA